MSKSGLTVMEKQAWEVVGQRLGGTVASLAVSPSFSENNLVLAGTMAGVFCSEDRGKTWKISNEGITSPYIQALVFAPNVANHEVAFAGALEGGVYRSDNGGETWQQLDFWQGAASVTCLAVSPSFADDGVMLAGTQEDGVFKSTNRGRTWNSANFGIMELSIQAVAISPNYEEDQTAFVAGGDGLYRTLDEGRAWRLVDRGLDSMAIQAIAVSPNFAEDRTVLVGTEDMGVFKSSDGGTNWQEANNGLDSVSINALCLSPDFATDSLAYAGTAEGSVCRSTDGGNTWESVIDQDSSVLCLLTTGTSDDDIVMAGVHREGVIRAHGDAANWENSVDGLAARSLLGTALSPNCHEDGTLFATSLEDGLLRSTDEGVSWEPAGAGIEEMQVASLLVSPDYANDSTVFAATHQGIAISADGGANWQTSNEGIEEDAQDLRVLAVSNSFASDRIVVAGGPGGALYFSHDAGRSWERAEESFGEEDVIGVTLSPNFADDSTLLLGTFRASKGDYASTITVWRSADGGEIWKRILVHATGAQWISFAMPPNYSGSDEDYSNFFIATATRFFRPMWRGKNLWVGDAIGEATAAVVCLAISPDYEQDTTIYAGTSRGVYKSADEGLTWKNINEGLDNKAIVSLLVSPNYASDHGVYAVSLGGTIWRYVDA